MKKVLPEGVRIEGYKTAHGVLKSIIVGKTDRHYYRAQLTGYRVPEDGRIKEVDFN